MPALPIPLPPGDDQGTVELRAKACTPVVIARDGERTLVSGECAGNTMCGSFGFWIIDKAGASRALTGCFAAMPSVIDWRTMTLSPPMRIDARPSCSVHYDEVKRRWVTVGGRTRCAS